MANENHQPDSTPGLPAQRPSLVSRITDVFYQPTMLFGRLTRKTEWLIPLIAFFIIGGVMNFITMPISVRDLSKRALENVEKYRQYIPPERFAQIEADINKRIKDAQAYKFEWYYPLIYLGFPLVFFLVISGVCIIVGNFIFGGKANFWIVVNVVAFAGLIGLLGDVVRELIMLGKDSAYVYTGLGLLKPVDDGTFIYYLLRQVDVFSVWRIVATVIGLGVIYKMKPAKFAYVLFPIWLIFIVVVGILNTFTGGTIIY